MVMVDVPPPVTRAEFVAIVSTTVLSELRTISMVPEPLVTLSLKFNTRFPDVEKLVVLSAGVEEVKVGGEAA
ncbi:hypothetical protein [Candidatus Magnetaquiglobus chichijimensis]|uniref:hypothetical protein n=1 Tax=Candidatus Magnetaquiglobus chichijimensis TaxID=3141448 RepID=UPI003B9749A2